MTEEAKKEPISLDQVKDIEAIKPEADVELTTVKIDPELKSISIRRENTRKSIAFFLLSVLAFTVFSSLLVIPLGKAFFISKYPKKDVEKILDKDTINLIWTSQVTLIGTVLGFYFGKESNSNDD